jgi:predicted secreted protein with PEFG-CTERM motif
LLALLVAVSLLTPSAVEAAPPRALASFSGALNPGEITNPPLDWQLNQDISGFVFHYRITGGAQLDDVVYVTFTEANLVWEFLMGEGWEYCEDCSFDAGTYHIEVEADASASGPIAFDIGVYRVEQPPVDFVGQMPANSQVGFSDFGVRFPNAGTYELTLGVTSGSYDFFVDEEDTPRATVTQTRELALDIATPGIHVLMVYTEEPEDVTWSVQIKGPPKLEVNMVDTCPVLNPESGESVCIIGAEATSSDGGNASISYLWNATPSGSFNSTTSQWVEWTAPPGVASYTLTVNASASGYLSDTDSLKVQVVPEFPSAVLPFLTAAAMAIVLFTRRQKRTTHSAH